MTDKTNPEEHLMYRAVVAEARLQLLNKDFALLAKAFGDCPDIARAVLGDSISGGLLRYLADVVDALRTGGKPRSLPNEVKNAVHASYRVVQPTNLFFS